MKFSRREFLANATVASAVLVTGLEGQEPKPIEHKPPALPSGPRKPTLICKSRAAGPAERAYQMLLRGADTLDVAIVIGKAQEDDPNDDTVGYGGLPNEEGEVELDACCMHGPTRRAGSVGGVRKIKNVSVLAKEVIEHTSHVMLVGEGAQKFAVAMGHPPENLLTERSKKTWLLWKETMSDKDWWGPGMADPRWKPPVTPPALPSPQTLQQRIDRLEQLAEELGIEPEDRPRAIRNVLAPPTGTIHISVLNAQGEMSGLTTTSGLAWKLPGRCGDSPIIGAGCYTDQDVGSAGATGSGEENIEIAGAHTIVEQMRAGKSPQEAGMEALRRLTHLYGNDQTKLRFIDMVYYILRNDGAYAGVSLWSHNTEGKRRDFLIHDGAGPHPRIEPTVALLQGSSIDWPPGFSLAPAAAATSR